MRLPLALYVLAAAITTVASLLPAHDVNDQEPFVVAQATQQQPAARKKRTVDPGLQIACTRLGCNPIPKGCRIEKEFSWDGTPTGYDLVVCPFR